MVDLLYTLLDPYILGGILLYAVTFMVLCLFFWQNRDFIAGLMLFYFVICSSIIIVAYLLNISLITPDAEYVFLPSARKVQQFFEEGFFSAIIDISRLQKFKLEIPFYTIPLGTILFIFQGSYIAGHLLSTIFGVLVIYNLYQITLFFYDKRTAQIAALVLAASPFYNWLSILIMRDTIGVFLILWFYRTWQLYELKNQKKYMIFLVLIYFCNILLRPPMAVVLMISVISYKLLGTGTIKSIIMRLIKFAGAGIFFAIIGWQILGSFINTESILLKGLKYAELETINKRAAESFEAGSSYLEVGMYQTYGDLFKYAPLLVFYFLCSPLPWQIKKPRHAFALIDSTVLWFIYVLFLMEIWGFWKKNKKWGIIILSYLLFGISSASLLQGNIGGSQRHRILFTIMMLPFAAHRLLKIFDKTGITNLFKKVAHHDYQAAKLN